MDSSRRAVESYWRSRMIDVVTSDEDKVALVYKLEEISQLPRSSHVSIIQEMSNFVKQKWGKSGVEFRREMQRHSVAVRQLFPYKGHPDPLKGDELNKAMQDTAQETINVIFFEECRKPTAAAPADDLCRRVQDEEKVLPVGCELSAVEVCGLQGGVPEIKSCSEMPYYQ